MMNCGIKIVGIWSFREIDGSFSTAEIKDYGSGLRSREVGCRQVGRQVGGREECSGLYMFLFP
jgi:hypothetical protein